MRDRSRARARIWQTSWPPVLALAGVVSATCARTELYDLEMRGGYWAEDSNVVLGGQGSAYPSIALDGQGNPVVAWSEEPAGGYRFIFVMRFDGTRWVEVGTGSASGAGISGNLRDAGAQSLALDVSGNPVVAWNDDRTGSDDIYVRRFDGAAWVEMGTGSATAGGISDTIGNSGSAHLGLGSSGAATVAWEDWDPLNAEIYVRSFDGTVWGELGAGSATGGGISDSSSGDHSPSVVVDAAGWPTVAWFTFRDVTPEIFVRRFDGMSWQAVGASSATGGQITPGGTPRMVLDGAGRPVILHVPMVLMGLPIFSVRRFEGDNWVELNDGSLTDDSGGSILWPPAIASDDSGALVVAWEAGTYTVTSEVYVRGFDGESWREIGEGSASGGGLSSSPGRSMAPSVAVDARGVCVSWTEASEIVVRCSARPIWL